MPKEAVFTMKLETELRDEFMAEAQALDRPASQLARELMREFVQRQREAREHQAFVQRKVKAAQAQVHSRIGRPNDVVETEFAARRASVLNHGGDKARKAVK